MPEGRIARYLSDRGFGFIQPTDGSPDVWFHIRVVQGATDADLVPGAVVRYETERAADNRIRARVVRLAQAPQAAGQPAQGAGPAGPAAASGEYRFLNPYNFVRWLPEPTRGDPLFGKCPPPTHDRYLGLTGRLTCELEAVTPLFVSDSHGIVEDGQHPDHKSYRFFQVGGQDAIPATSLRGALRSGFEAVTNSCFSTFASPRLSYHLPATDARRLVPARVERQGEAWRLRLLPGTTRFSLEGPGFGEPLFAAWVHLYSSLRPSATLRAAPTTPYALRKKVTLPSGVGHRSPCYALVERVTHPERGRQRAFDFWNVVAVAATPAGLPPAGPGQDVHQGWLCLTNQNIENKHDERFFFATGAPLVIPLQDDHVAAYQALIGDYQERHRDEVVKRAPASPAAVVHGDPAFSPFIYDKAAAKLRDGDLVYAMLEGTPRQPEVTFIVPVSIPRVSYNREVGDEALLPHHLHHCNHVDALCPACRTFGWVLGAHAERDPELRQDRARTTAYAGRVRFSHARLTHDAGVLGDETLAILSSPKPTTTRFYLRKRQGEWTEQERQSDTATDYDSDHNALRGRKVYRHHGPQLNPQEYRRATDANHPGKDDQNRTVRGARKPGNKFTFTVDFHNLAPVELAALLWTLELEPGMVHRLGFAKPLGFGSARIAVTRMEVMDPGRRYTSLDDSGGWTDVTQTLDRAAWVRVNFKAEMATAYGRPFDQLDNVRDLTALLSAPTASLPVHYPRSSRRPDPEGKNFEWFVGNKRTGRDHGPHLALDLAPADTQGLPLLNKDGEKVR